jgi:methyl-accepting chemotaxis protein
MKIRTFLVAFFIMLFCMAGANLVLGYYLSQAEKKIEGLRTESNELAVIADDFVISSQWACRFARTFIATLDPKRATYYFLIGDIVEGRIARPANYSFAYWDLVAGGLLNPPSEKGDGISIEERFRRADASTQEVDELAKARSIARRVTLAEITAIHAARGEFPDTNGAFIKKGKPDLQRARDLLFNQQYSVDKAELSQAILTVKEMISKRYATATANQQSYVDALLQANTILGIILAGLIIASLFKLRQIILSLKKVADGVASGGVQLQSASKQVSAGAAEQANSVQETAAAMEQMAAAIRQNADASANTFATSTRVAEDARTCTKEMQRTAAAMKGIAEKSLAVEDITRKIELLALNAAVEAARAGEYGKGFAVVAAEVSKLADLSKDATASIQQSSMEGRDTAERTDRMLTMLLPAIEKQQDLVRSIQIASEEQATGAQQVNDAMRRLDDVMQSNASAADQVSTIASDLADHAQRLQNEIGGDQTKEALIAATQPVSRDSNSEIDRRDFSRY